MLFSRQPLTAEELAERSGGAYPTVTKEVRRLEQLDIVVVTTVGRTKLLTANRDDPSVRALSRLFTVAGLGPLPPPEGGDDMAKKKSKKKDGKKKKK